MRIQKWKQWNKKEWGTYPNLQHFGVEGHAGALGWGLEQMTNRAIIHMNLQKPNNKVG